MIHGKLITWYIAPGNRTRICEALAGGSQRHLIASNIYIHHEPQGNEQSLFIFLTAGAFPSGMGTTQFMFMKSIACLAVLAAACLSGLAAEKESRFFELRTYYAAPGKLDALQARFRNHTLKIFEKHGMENIGYWLPLTNTENKLVYLLAYPSREAREKSWKEFSADPVWQEVAKATEKDGRLVSKADSLFLAATDFSPVVEPSASGSPQLFELRTYKATPGKLNALLTRFRDHTVELFAKHGMRQFGYWVPTEKKDGAEDTLVYILKHKNQAAWENSFKEFRADPEWVKVKADSEKDGSLTVKDGVQSLLMSPTDFSPAK